MATAQSKTVPATRPLFEVSELFLARHLSELRTSSSSGVMFLLAVDGARIVIEKSRKRRLHWEAAVSDDVDIELCNEVRQLLREQDAEVPDVDACGGAFVPAWIVEFSWDVMLPVLTRMRSSLATLSASHGKPVYVAIGENELSVVSLLQLASDDQIVVSSPLWNQMSPEQQRLGTSIGMHPPECPDRTAEIMRLLADHDEGRVKNPAAAAPATRRQRKEPNKAAVAVAQGSI